MRQPRPWTVALWVTIAVLGWGAAFYVLQLHIRTGPAQQPVNIRWAPQTTALARQTAESALNLRDGEESESDPGTWVYHTQEHSREAIRQIVTHPLVEDTGHIDRDAFRILIDAPEVPAWLRRLLEADLGPAVSFIAALVGLVPVWVFRRELRQTALRVTALQEGASWRARVLVAALLAVYAVELVRTAWIADDAAITLRTVLNFINGYGARFNLDERVQAYTHPLWFLIISAASFLGRNVFITTLLLSGVFSLGSLYLLVRSARTLATGMLVAFGLMLSKAYVDFSISGLENPLSHFVLLLTAIAALRAHEESGQRWLELSCFGLGIVYLTRPDLVLLVFPLVAFVVVQQRPPAQQLVKALAIAAGPAVVWTAVSLYYYGFPFPNPAYAKLGSGLPLVERVTQGGRYFLHSVPRDMLTLVLIALGIGSGVMRRGASGAIAGGIVLYLVYVASVGGDFMEGRFLTCPLVLSALLLARVDYSAAKRVTLAVCIVGLGALGLPNTLLSGAGYRGPTTIGPDGIADERGTYFQDFGWLNVEENLFVSRDWQRDARDPNRTEIACGRIGFDSIISGPSVHFIDPCGLADPLLARLPAVEIEDWRIGHFDRRLPEGYVDSVRTRGNLLTRPDMRAYYESIRQITRGNLNDPRRLLEILRFNSGLVSRPN